MPRKTKKRRLTKIERQHAEMQRLAGLLASSGEGVTAPPELLTDPRRAVALKFWTDHAPRLAALGVLDDLSRTNLWLLAAYVSEWIAADDEVLRRGYSVMVKTISGDRMPRENAAVGRREAALKAIMELERHFGFSALDRATLHRTQRGANVGPDLFAQRSHTKATAQTDNAALSEDDREWRRLARPDGKELN